MKKSKKHSLFLRCVSLTLCMVLVLAAIPLWVSAESYMWPVVNGRNISQGYKSTHKAVDLTGGGNIVATKSGTVYRVYSGCGNYNAFTTQKPCSSATCACRNLHYYSQAGGSVCNYGYGNGVVIVHDDGSGFSMYAHLGSVAVSQGSWVKQGTVLGTMGSSGASYGQHLHFELSSGSPGTGGYISATNPINPTSLSYVDYGSSGGTTPSISISFASDTSDQSRSWVGYTNAILATTVRVTGAPISSVTSVGVYLYNDAGAEIGGKVEGAISLGGVINAYYDVNSELGVTLAQGSPYKYKFVAVVNGVTYTSQMFSLVTQGASYVTVTFDPNGGSVSPTSQRVVVGGRYGTLPIPTRTGYTFTDWNFDRNPGMISEMATTGSIVSRESNHTLYAQWRANEYTITFNTNGANIDMFTQPVWYENYYGYVQGLPNLTRDGYRFEGWYTAPSGGVRVYDGTVYTIAGNSTVYAQWSRKVTLGDVDGNDKIDATDALKALQHAVKLVNLAGDAYTAANVNGDDSVNASDALLILQYTVKLIGQFPTE